MGIKLNTTRRAFPMIYAYSTPQIADHDGWTKIGYTEAIDVEARIRQQTHTSDTLAKLEWKGAAIFDDGSGGCFKDKAFHAYLRKCGIENKKSTEWFHINGPDGQLKFFEFRADRGILKALCETPYILREEQARAVHDTFLYKESHENGEYLWNAKPRFGKSLSTYDFCKKSHAQKVLIVTNRPAIANSWYSDFVQFMGDSSGYKFVSETDALKGLPYVLSRDEYNNYRIHTQNPLGCIQFVSLQDLKGSKYFGGVHDKLVEVKKLEWDILIVDEAHEGVDTLKTNIAFEQIKRKFTLHLSGTPFKALANDKFPDGAIFNWTYADEQRAKQNWPEDSEFENPYDGMPKLNLYTYQMSEIIKEEIDRGLEIDGETHKFAEFDLNDLFETRNGSFVRDGDVDKFLDALTTLAKFPFSTEELRNKLKHTFWLLNRVDSAKALAKKLNNHEIFKDYEVVLAAGDGRRDPHEEYVKSFNKVRNAIKNFDKTITLSVGQLTTGVTIPEWTAVLMLSNVKSPALYMQAAFRAQNPWMYHEDGNFYRKENAYVFDFDPARTLIIFEEFANDLCSNTANGKGDSETRKENVRDLLNFFPVIGEDENGEMINLDAEQVLSIPRKIKSEEVVRKGFMSNYLFQNITGIFSAPPKVISIISKVPPTDEIINVTSQTKDELNINSKTGNVEVPFDKAKAQADDLFGPRIYEVSDRPEVSHSINNVVNAVSSNSDSDIRTVTDNLVDTLKDGAVKDAISSLKDTFGGDLRPSDAKKIKSSIISELEVETKKVIAQHNIDKYDLENARKTALERMDETGKSEEQIKSEFDAKLKALGSSLPDKLRSAVNECSGRVAAEAVQIIQTKIKERSKEDIEETVRKHLRGFSRTIPSFLMAYGNDTVTLSTFDQIIPDQVFLDVTSISLDEFRFLRDGGIYTDEAGEEKLFPGNLFDPVVFDDSVQEFLRLKKKLADYFDENSIEDIFDYIPPQKTNQIFTPKTVVKKMVDMLEAENPGCFDDPEKTFIDLYMKSGLYITEIVKRLYQSEEMKIWFPDPKERLRHIFEKQVYGLAPTEIIYRIALSYILGFTETSGITKYNFHQVDALSYVKNGTLSELLNELFQKRFPAVEGSQKDI